MWGLREIVSANLRAELQQQQERHARRGNSIPRRLQRVVLRVLGPGDHHQAEMAKAENAAALRLY